MNLSEKPTIGLTSTQPETTVQTNSDEASPMGGTHLYKHIEQELTQSIHQGQYKPGDALPAEKFLAQHFGVSIGTLRKAVDSLVGRGVLLRQQGRGTFVARHNKDRYLFAYFHVVRQDGVKTYPLLELALFTHTKADKQIARRLAIKVGSKVFKLINILHLHGRRVVIDEIYLPEKLFPDLSEQVVRERPNTLYQLYQERFGLTVVRAEERLRAVRADAFQASTLGLPPGEPLLQVIRVAQSFNNQPVELRYSFVNTLDYEYFAELTPTS